MMSNSCKAMIGYPRAQHFEEEIGHFDLGTAAAVQRRLLLTAEGIALRRLCFEVDAFQAGMADGLGDGYPRIAL